MSHDVPGSLMSTAVDRKGWITACLLERGSVTIAEVVEQFAVSRMTVHRDLDELVAEGWARKVRGGATALPSTLYESDVRFRSTQHVSAKRALCAAAAAWLEPGVAVLLDEATTALPLLDHLAEVGYCTVVTNFRMALNRLAEQELADVDVLALGGRYHRRFDSYTGPLCAEQLGAVHADVYVTSTTAADEGAAWHPDAEIAAVKQAMLAAARTRLLLVDRSKLGRSALHRVARLSEFDAVIVQRETASEIVDRLDAAGIAVHLAPPTAELDVS